MAAPRLPRPGHQVYSAGLNMRLTPETLSVCRQLARATRQPVSAAVRAVIDLWLLSFADGSGAIDLEAAAAAMSAYLDVLAQEGEL